MKRESVVWRTVRNYWRDRDNKIEALLFLAAVLFTIFVVIPYDRWVDEVGIEKAANHLSRFLNY